jgi:hypothetical protein
MDNPSAEQKNQTSGSPQPEVLSTRSEDGTPANEGGQPSAPATDEPKVTKRLHHNAYRPTHRATFIALGVVVAILAVNAAIIGFVLKSQSKDKKLNSDQVTISQAVLDKVGVNRTSIGDSGIQLNVGPNAKFSNNVEVGGDVSIAGELKLNSKFSANDASLAQLEAGDVKADKLNINGDATMTNLKLRKDLEVAGTAKIQGAVTISNLLTVYNNVNVSGNLAVGGTLSAGGLSVSSLYIGSNLVIGGHIITRGSAPGASAGSAAGSNGTVSISGNDAAGTVVVNVGTGAGAGTLVFVTFDHSYTNTPHVVVTAVGASAGNFYINRSATGFSIAVPSGLSAGSRAFDYIVEQ